MLSIRNFKTRTQSREAVAAINARAGRKLVKQARSAISTPQGAQWPVLFKGGTLAKPEQCNKILKRFTVVNGQAIQEN